MRHPVDSLACGPLRGISSAVCARCMTRGSRMYPGISIGLASLSGCRGVGIAQFGWLPKSLCPPDKAQQKSNIHLTGGSARHHRLGVGVLASRSSCAAPALRVARDAALRRIPVNRHPAHRNFCCLGVARRHSGALLPTKRNGATKGAIRG